MKNKTFRIAVGVCFGAVLLAETTLLTVPAALTWGQAGHIAVSNLANGAKKSLLPAVAAGLVLLLGMGRLRLWQCCTLGLSIVISFSLFRNLFGPLVEMYMSEGAVPYSISLTEIKFYFQEAGGYLFPVFIGALTFYGFACKKRVTAILCSMWSIANWILFPLLLPFFQKFDARAFIMDGGSSSGLQISYGLFNWAAIVLLVLILSDLYSQKGT